MIAESGEFVKRFFAVVKEIPAANQQDLINVNFVKT